MAAARCAMRGPDLPRALKTPLANWCCRPTSQLPIRHFSPGPGIASKAPSFEIRKSSGKQDEPHKRSRRRIVHRLPDGSEDMTGPPGSARRAEVIQYTLTKGEPRYSRFTPDAWVKDSVLELCRNELPAELRADPLSYFESDRDNLDIAGRCLTYYIVWHHQSLSSRSQVRDRFQKDHAGQRALLWFIDNSVFRNTDLKLHPRFLRGLVHCLVAEEASERVTDFIRLAPSPSALPLIDDKISLGWKDDVLGWLLQSTGYWANDDLSASLQLFIRLPESTSDRLPMWSAVDWVCTRLASHSAKTGSPGLYDRLPEAVRRHGHKERRQWRLAQLALQHPTRPSVDPFMDFLDCIPDLASRDPFITKLVQPRTPNEAARLYTTVHKASWVLCKQQKIEDAKALLEHAFDEFPDVFRRRHQAIVPQEGMWDAGAKKVQESRASKASFSC